MTLSSSRRPHAHIHSVKSIYRANLAGGSAWEPWGLRRGAGASNHSGLRNARARESDGIVASSIVPSVTWNQMSTVNKGPGGISLSHYGTVLVLCTTCRKVVVCTGKV